METSLETRDSDAVEIGGKFFTRAEAREIDDQIDKLDALMKQRREQVLASMAAEQCSCTLCQHTRAKAGVSLCDTVFA